jgi:hypothetical protein
MEFVEFVVAFLFGAGALVTFSLWLKLRNSGHLTLALVSAVLFALVVVVGLNPFHSRTPSPLSAPSRAAGRRPCRASMA